jgi:hypothetical protein
MARRKKSGGFFSKVGKLLKWANPLYLVYRAGSALYNELAQNNKLPEGSKIEKKKVGGSDVEVITLPSGAQIIRSNKLTPEQTKQQAELFNDFVSLMKEKPEPLPDLKQFIQLGSEAAGIPEDMTKDIASFDFEKAVAQPETRRFHEQILPGLAAMETAEGGAFQPSGAFQRQKQMAGVKLSERLAALRAEKQPQYDFKKALLGMTGRQEKLQAGQMALNLEQLQRAPAVQQRNMLQQWLMGGPASQYEQMYQPGAPSSWQTFSSGFGQGLGKTLPTLLLGGL